MAVGLSGRVRRWFRKRVGGRRRGRRVRVRHRRESRGGEARLNAAIAAYQRAMNWGERVSRFAQEAVEVPASRQDGRRPVPGRLEWGRAYFNVVTDPKGLSQIDYERLASQKKGNGRWVLYRKTEISTRA